MNLRFRVIATFGAVVLAAGLAATPASANMLLPMFYFPMYTEFLALIPIMIIEGIAFGVLYRRNSERWHALRDEQSRAFISIVANLVSFGAGIIASLLQDSLFTHMLWEVPEGSDFFSIAHSIAGSEEQPPLINAAAFLLLLIPAFIGSWLIEGAIMRWMSGLDYKRALEASLIANAASYTCLLLIVGAIILA